MRDVFVDVDRYEWAGGQLSNMEDVEVGKWTYEDRFRYGRS